MSLLRSDTAVFARRLALSWAASAVLVVALAAVCGAFERPLHHSADAAAFIPADGAQESGDREVPPHRIADECSASLKRRRVCTDWLAVAVGPAAAAGIVTAVPVLVAANTPSSIREPVDRIDAFRVEPCDWSAARLRVCRGRAPPIA